VEDGLGVLVADGRQVAQMDAAVDGLGVFLAAVDRDVMAAGGKARGEFFGEGFEAAVVGGYAACAKQSDAHQKSVRVKGPKRP